MAAAGSGRTVSRTFAPVRGWLLLPSWLVIGIFLLLPVLMMLVYSFLTKEFRGGVIWEFSLAAYDQFLFEVQTRSGVKFLHDMKPGEMGGLVVSTPVLPRYRIGDLIRAFQAPYFRCIGRERRWTSLDYFWGEFMSLNLGRL